MQLLIQACRVFHSILVVCEGRFLAPNAILNLNVLGQSPMLKGQE